MDGITKGMKQCDVCGIEFPLSAEKHYIARDTEVSGLATLGRKEEVQLYDGFDCPHCGCQNIVQQRKRAFVQTVSIGDPMHYGEDEEEEYPDEVVFVEREEKATDDNEQSRTTGVN